MAKNDTPQERLLEFGAKSLSNYELLAIILRSGTPNKNVLELSIEILKFLETDENRYEPHINNLKDIPGIGKIKAIIILALLELVIRMKNPKRTNVKLYAPETIYEFMKNDVSDLTQEYFYCLYLDSKCQLIDKKLIYIGTANKTLIHAREIFRYAVKWSAFHIILIHNHPSGDCNPSKEDIQITNNLISASEVIDIKISDHIIISNQNYYSFLLNGLIK